MAAPKSTLWKMEPHTEAKHKILRKYLEAWFPILSRWPKIMYFDGFAAAGEYEGHEPGSPIIALDIAENHTAELTEIEFVFVEKEKDRCDHLKALLEPRLAKLPSNFRVEVYHSQFDQILQQKLGELERSAGSVPTFAFIDPFGFGGVPMDLVQRLLRRPQNEAFILFARSSVNRFVDHPQESIRAQITELFGVKGFDNLLQSANRGEELRALYHRKLSEAARFVRSFQMHDKHDQIIYDLFFATNHERGHTKMKEAMWGVDEWGDFRFSDASIPGSATLFQPNPEMQLLPHILKGGAGRSDVLAEKIRAWVDQKTGFLEKHAVAALRHAEKNGDIVVSEVKSDGTRRKKGTFPAGTLIEFVR